MPIAPVDDQGTVLFYEDSGILSSDEPYTTLVLIHGLMYTSDVFSKLLPFAAQYRLRLIRVNQRDYPPSSLFTPSEIEEFVSTDKDTQYQGLAKRGAEIANLLIYLINNLKLPPISTGINAEIVGGVSVLGWSLGSHLPLALLSNASALPREIQLQLQRYLRSAVLFDPSMFPVGVPIPPIVFTPDRPKGLYWPSFDQSISPEGRSLRFGPWVSSYYDPIEDISSVTLGSLGERLAIQDLREDALRALNVDVWKKVPTLQRFIPEELAALSSPESTARYFETFGKLDVSIHGQSFRRALGLDAEPLTWPECKLILVWCDMTLVDCIIASSTVVQLLNDEGPRIRRKVEVEKLAGSNHFPHWDEPEKVVSFLVNYI